MFSQNLRDFVNHLQLAADNRETTSIDNLVIAVTLHAQLNPQTGILDDCQHPA